MAGSHQDIDPTPTVLYIGGPGRTGSTLLGNILNEVPGFFHAGELRDIWRILDQGLPMPCGCGQALTNCPVWSEVLGLVLPPGRGLKEFAAQAHAWQRSRIRTLRTLRLLKTARGREDASTHSYLEVLERLYRAIARVTAADVIVDSSKAPAQAAALTRLERVRPRVMLLVRDPRAVAQAWSATKGHLARQPAAAVSLRWLLDSVGAELAGASLAQPAIRLRYEDLLAAPAPAVARILAWAGAGERPNPVNERTVLLTGNHTVSGNPGRSLVGTIELRPTRGLEAGAGRGQALLVLILTFPGRRRYGY